VAYYNDFLHDYRQECLDKIMRESDTIRIHRLQGNLEVLDFLLGLRGEMDTYIKGVASGQMRKVEKKEEKETEHGVGR